MGPLILLPYSISNGENPVVSCALLYMRKAVNLCTYPSLWVVHYRSFFKICLRVPLNFSTSPLHMGWYGVDVNCLIERSRLTSPISCEVNCVPISVSISRGTPALLKTSTIFRNSFCFNSWKWYSFGKTRGIIHYGQDITVLIVS